MVRELGAYCGLLNTIMQAVWLRQWGRSGRPEACHVNGIYPSFLRNYDKRAKADTDQDQPLYLRASTAQSGLT
jgi:hypothetical protein